MKLPGLLLLMAFAAQSLFSEPLFQNGEKLIFPKAATHKQMCSAIVITKNKHVIVFDGGNYGDHEHLSDVIAKYNGTVDCWFLTHCHDDHCGALIELFRKNPDKLKVMKILFTFPPLEWMQANEKWSRKESEQVYGGLAEITWPKGDVKKGDVFTVDGVTVTVLNNVYTDIKTNAGNNSSITFRVDIGGKRLMVPGDIGIETSNRLVKDCGKDLKADIVLLSHHGQNGASKEYYAAVSPSIAIWDTPQWLWDNDRGGGPGSGSWQTNFVKCWMQELGVKKQYRNWEDIVLE